MRKFDFMRKAIKPRRSFTCNAWQGSNPYQYPCRACVVPTDQITVFIPKDIWRDGAMYFSDIVKEDNRSRLYYAMLLFLGEMVSFAGVCGSKTSTKDGFWYVQDDGKTVVPKVVTIVELLVRNVGNERTCQRAGVQPSIYDVQNTDNRIGILFTVISTDPKLRIIDLVRATVMNNRQFLEPESLRFADALQFDEEPEEEEEAEEPAPEPEQPAVDDGDAVMTDEEQKKKRKAAEEKKPKKKKKAKKAPYVPKQFAFHPPKKVIQHDPRQDPRSFFNHISRLDMALQLIVDTALGTSRVAGEPNYQCSDALRLDIDAGNPKASLSQMLSLESAIEIAYKYAMTQNPKEKPKTFYESDDEEETHMTAHPTSKQFNTEKFWISMQQPADFAVDTFQRFAFTDDERRSSDEQPSNNSDDVNDGDDESEDEADGTVWHGAKIRTKQPPARAARQRHAEKLAKLSPDVIRMLRSPEFLAPFSFSPVLSSFGERYSGHELNVCIETGYYSSTKSSIYYPPDEETWRLVCKLAGVTESARLTDDGPAAASSDPAADLVPAVEGKAFSAVYPELAWQLEPMQLQPLRLASTRFPWKPRNMAWMIAEYISSRTGDSARAVYNDVWGGKRMSVDTHDAETLALAACERLGIPMASTGSTSGTLCDYGDVIPREAGKNVLVSEMYLLGSTIEHYIVHIQERRRKMLSEKRAAAAESRVVHRLDMRSIARTRVADLANNLVPMDAARYTTLMRALRRIGLREMQSLFTEQAAVPIPVKTIPRWALNHEQLCFQIHFNMPNVGTFGTLLSNMMLLCTDARISCNHHTLVMLMTQRDATTLALAAGSLALNIKLLGPFAAGKSTALYYLVIFSAPGATNIMGGTSTKGILPIHEDGHEIPGDSVTLMSEAVPILTQPMDKLKMDDRAMQSMVNEALTSKMIFYTFVTKDEATGKLARVTKVVIGAFSLAICTNDSDAKNALSSRFGDVRVGEEKSGNRTSLKMIASAQPHGNINIMSCANVLGVPKRVIDSMQTFNALVFVACKAIEARALPLPNLDWLRVFFSYTVKYMSDKLPQVCSKKIRKFEIAWTLGYTWTVWDAISIMFCPTAFENGEMPADYTHDNIRLLAPYLFCREEVAFAAMSFCVFSAVDPLSFMIARFLCERRGCYYLTGHHAKAIGSRQLVEAGVQRMHTIYDEEVEKYKNLNGGEVGHRHGWKEYDEIADIVFGWNVDAAYVVPTSSVQPADAAARMASIMTAPTYGSRSRMSSANARTIAEKRANLTQSNASYRRTINQAVLNQRRGNIPAQAYVAQLDNMEVSREELTRTLMSMPENDFISLHKDLSTQEAAIDRDSFGLMGNQAPCVAGGGSLSKDQMEKLNRSFISGESIVADQEIWKYKMVGGDHLLGYDMNYIQLNGAPRAIVQSLETMSSAKMTAQDAAMQFAELFTTMFPAHLVPHVPVVGDGARCDMIDIERYQPMFWADKRCPVQYVPVALMDDVNGEMTIYINKEYAATSPTSIYREIVAKMCTEDTIERDILLMTPTENDPTVLETAHVMPTDSVLAVENPCDLSADAREILQQYGDDDENNIAPIVWRGGSELETLKRMFAENGFRHPERYTTPAINARRGIVDIRKRQAAGLPLMSYPINIYKEAAAKS